MSKLIGIGALIDRSWDQYRANVGILAKINAWMLLVLAVNILILFIYPDAHVMANNIFGMLVSSTATFSGAGFGYAWKVLFSSGGFPIWLLLFNNLIFAFAIGIWVMNATVTTIHAQSNGERPNMKTVSKRAWELFFPLLKVGIYWSIALAASVLVAFGVLWFILEIMSSFLPYSLLFILSFLALLLFLLPIAFILYTSFTVFTLADGSSRGWGAITESARLIYGQFWSVFPRIVIPMIMYLGVFFLLQWFLLLIIEMLVVSLGHGAANELAANRIYLIGSWSSYALLNIFFSPWLFVNLHVIYKELKSL